MFKFIEDTVKNMRTLLDVSNSDFLNNNYHNDVKCLIKVITDLFNKMNTETNSLVSFSNEHKIIRKNYNLLNLKLDSVIEKLNSLLESESARNFAQEILKGKMAIIDFYGNNNYHNH